MYSQSSKEDDNKSTECLLQVTIEKKSFSLEDTLENISLDLMKNKTCLKIAAV